MTHLSVPRLDPTVELAPVADDLAAAAAAVIRSGRYIGGPEVDALEREIAAELGVAHALGVASGTDALTIALVAAAGNARGERAGHEVITTAFSFSATASAIVRAGLRPRFVDIDDATFNLRADQVADAIGPRTAAVVPVHLYGRVADMDAICAAASGRAAPVPVIEDACQAYGARALGHGGDGGRPAGALAAAAAFSFFPSKPLGGFGDGGLIATDRADIADLARALARHGARARYRSELCGFNSRLDALQAAMLRVVLPHVRAARDRRERIAARYRGAFADLPGLIVPDAVSGHAWHCFAVRVRTPGGGGEPGAARDALLRGLVERGIDAVVQYPVALHRMAPFATGQSLPAAERACAELLCLPIWSRMTDDQIDHVIASVTELLQPPVAPVS